MQDIKVVSVSKIPDDSLVNNYLPGNFKDVFECVIAETTLISADDILIAFWTKQPKWLTFLFSIRNILVRPFGLKGAENTDKERLEECIRDGGQYGLVNVLQKSEKETVLYLEDKHLGAYLSVYVERGDSSSVVDIITLVKFHNWLGYLYFYAILPFHKVVVKSMLKNAIKNALVNKNKNRL